MNTPTEMQLMINDIVNKAVKDNLKNIDYLSRRDYFDDTCTSCNIYSGLCQMCTVKLGSDISISSMKASVSGIEYKILDELSFDGTVAKHKASNKFIGDLPPYLKGNLNSSNGFIGYVQNVSKTFHFLYSDSISIMALKRVAEAYTSKHTNMIQIEKNRRRDWEARVQRDKQIKEQLLIKQRERLILDLRFATCFRCKNSLSTESHLICFNCRWIKCSCGGCGCNYY